MFDDILFGKYYQQMSSPKLFKSIDYKIPSTPVKSKEQPPILTPDYNLHLLVNSVLSSPLTRCQTFPSSDINITATDQTKKTDIAGESLSQTTIIPSFSKSRMYLRTQGRRNTDLVQEKNESDYEFKKRRNRVNQQRSRSNRNKIIKDLREELDTLKAILAEKDQLIATLQSK